MSALSQSSQVAFNGASAGAMGAGMALVAAKAGHPALLFNVRGDAAQATINGVGRNLEKLVAKGRLDTAQAQRLLDSLRVIDSLDALSDADLVLEAITEDLTAKHELFLELEKHGRPDALVATNTSSVSVIASAAPLQYPGRFAGMHFFNPAPLMAPVEIVSGLAPSSDTRELLFDTAHAGGKEPVHARSTPGFIVNRVARPFYAEGLRLVDEGVADDVSAAVTRSVFDAYAHDSRFKPSLLQQELVATGRKGRKSGRGFYDYAEGAERPPVSDGPGEI